MQWAFHLKEVANPARFEPAVNTIFIPKFLFWLEVVSILHRVDDGLRGLAAAELSVCPSSPSITRTNHVALGLFQRALQFVRDSMAFITFARNAIETSAPHIYLSALPFASHQSAVVDALCRPFVQLPQVQISGRIDCTVHVLRGHESAVSALARSSDSRFLVSGSSDMTVRVWDMRTDLPTQLPFTGHTAEVTAVTFSPDGSQVVSGSA